MSTEQDLRNDLIQQYWPANNAIVSWNRMITPLYLSYSIYIDAVHNKFSTSGIQTNFDFAFPGRSFYQPALLPMHNRLCVPTIPDYRYQPMSEHSPLVAKKPSIIEKSLQHQLSYHNHTLGPGSVRYWETNIRIFCAARYLWVLVVNTHGEHR